MTSARSGSDAPLAGWPRPLAFVLSGGGAFGSVQVGMLRALAERGIEPDLIVGSSVGSLHGVMVASGRPDAIDALRELWRTIDRRTIFGGPFSVLRSLLTSRTLAGFERLEALIRANVPVSTFEELAVPFVAVATDALSGEPELLRTGPIVPAILASSAVPGVFPPVRIGDRHYVDGGVAANIPIRQAIACGAGSIVCLDATPPAFASRVPPTLFGRLAHSAALMLRNQRAHSVDDLASRHRIAILPSPVPPDVGTFNFARNRALVDDSYHHAAETIDGWLSSSETVGLVRP